MLNSTHNLTDLHLGDIDRGRGGGLRPEVQPLPLLYTSFDRKSTSFASYFVNITTDTSSPGADPEFFSGGGALVSCSTSTPINHIVFFWQNTNCIRKPQVISGGGVRTPCTLPLDPPLVTYESCLVFFTAIKYTFWVLPQTAMIDFPTLFYKSTSETPTLSYTGILKKVPLWALK